LSAALSDDNSPQSKPSASIVGTVTFEGDVPKAAVADNSGVPRPLLAVDPKSRGLQYAVVYLTGDFPRPIGDEPPDPAAKPTLIDQEHETFVPRLVAIQDGRRVRFKNSDGGNHNVRTATLDPRNEFNVFTGAGTSYEHAFHADPKQRPVRIGCDLHPWMRAWVYVFDHPYFAVTDEKGRFEIKDVPPGTYRLVVRQPDGGLSREQELVLRAGESRAVNVGFKRDDVRIGP
jgi:plastocyanin